MIFESEPHSRKTFGEDLAQSISRSHLSCFPLAKQKTMVQGIAVSARIAPHQDQLQQEALG